MGNKLVKFDDGGFHAPSFTIDDERTLKQQICKDLTDSEMKVFLMFCVKSGLDPFTKEIYAIKRGGQMTIQTSIDGLRLMADRTGCYAPGPEPTYTYDANGYLLSATAYVKKMTADGTWHTVAATAHYAEYVALGKDGQPSGLWKKMPHCMTAKCAEALAIRKAHTKAAKLYIKEEMDQADSPYVPEDIPLENKQIAAPPAKISSDQAFDLECLIEECDPGYKSWFYDFIKKQFNSDILLDIPLDKFETVRNSVADRMHRYQAKQRQEFERKQLENQTVDASFDVETICGEPVSA